MAEQGPKTIVALGREVTVGIGIVLIVVGVLMLLAEYQFVANFRVSWPVILIIIGAATLFAYTWSKPLRQYLEWGFFLVCIGAAFYWIHDVVGPTEGYRIWWPLIFLAGGLGMLLAELLGPGPRRQLLPGMVIIGISAMMQAMALNQWRTWDIDTVAWAGGIVCILIGMVVVGQSMVSRGNGR